MTHAQLTTLALKFGIRPGDRLADRDGVGVDTKERTDLRGMTITQPFDATKSHAIARCLINVRV